MTFKIKSALLLFIFCGAFMVKASAQQDTTQTPPPEPAPKVRVQLDKSDAALGISPQTKARIKLIKNPPVNIALFAVDRRTKEDAGNSDVIMVISVDQTSGKIKMASIMRDSYVKIEGKGMDKINAAYALGGPQLAIKTINQNFGMDIKDYINVDFYTAARIIDALGGVDINVKPEEIKILNHYLDELSIYEKLQPQYVTEPGMQKLTGRQTVAYTRIRYVGNGDYERTERQRTVLIELFKKMKTSGTNMIPVFTKDVLPNLETSMSNMTLSGFAASIFYSPNKTIEQGRFPLDSESHGKKINNIWYLITDLKAASASLHQFIYKK